MSLSSPRTQVPPESHPPGGVWPGPGCYLTDWRAALRSARHACCCEAKPTIAAILPAAAGRPGPADLLLCGHHYRRSQQALVKASAAVFDAAGRPLTYHTWLLVHSW